MDDRELRAETQTEMKRRFDAAAEGSAFDEGLYAGFMRDYARTRGFDIAGVDYEAEFDTDAIVR
jgi:enoyl-[acyl-carrier protein] reductase / trans-2-enoyl-CoA reductase (NAD+)